MEQSLLNIGFGSAVVAERVVAIVSPNSAPMKRLKDEAKNDKRLIDATHGRRTRSIIVMDSNHLAGYERARNMPKQCGSTRNTQG
jgi:regulator of extracellular matrix RemA (YlzA/DUF370 family)